MAHDKHVISQDDHDFLSRLEEFRIPAGQFHHAEHIRLAYICLVGNSSDEALLRIRTILKDFLKHVGADDSKYHETVTQAWILAVDHFMQNSKSVGSSQEFIEANPSLLKTDIMLTHYSKELLFSDAARTHFIEPDLDPIPRYA